MSEQTISQMILQDRNRVFTLEEVEEVNLIDLAVTVNQLTIRVQKGNGDLFFVKRPNKIDCLLSMYELATLETLVRAKPLSYTVHYYRPHYSENQGDKWMASMELETGLSHPLPNVTLIDFGASYGKLKVNNEIVVDISHAGGSGPDHPWADLTAGFHFVGRNRVQAMKSLIAHMER